MPPPTPLHEDDDEPEFDDFEQESFEDFDEDERWIRTISSPNQHLQTLIHLISTSTVPLHVHEVVVVGNDKTKTSLIKAIVEDSFRSASTVRELVRAAEIANARLKELGIFESVAITLDSGPPEMPGSASVVVRVTESRVPVGGALGVYSSPWASSRLWLLGLSLKLKNMLGFGDIWDASGICSWNQVAEISAGVSLPRVRALATPLTFRASLPLLGLSCSASHKGLCRLSAGLVSTEHHNLSYSLMWHILDPSLVSIKRQLGHNLFSSLKHTFKLDRRDSHLTPTRGYALLSTTKVDGLGDGNILQSIRQELDLQAALPLGFYNAALNFGVSAGIILPLRRGFLNLPLPSSDRFFLDERSSLIGGLRGPNSCMGFKSQGFSLMEYERFFTCKSGKDDSNSSEDRDVHTGDLAINTFADLSFDLPSELLRESGIRGHTFVCAGNVTQLADSKYRNFSFRDFLSSFRSSAGIGVVIPTNIIRMEINYCFILKQLQHDRFKTGFLFSFASPS